MLYLDLCGSSQVDTYIKNHSAGYLRFVYSALCKLYSNKKKFKCFLITTCEVGPEVIIIISILQTRQLRLKGS